MKRLFTLVSSSDPHSAGMPSEPALVAHLLRRLTFGPHPGEIDRYADLDPAEVVATILAQPAIEPDSPNLGTDDDYSNLLRWWLDVMASPEAGLHERLVWFWHGHLTSSFDQADPLYMYRQHLVLRQYALGNFRTLLHEITLDPAMLWWLDGDGSRSEAPNENYAREVMELFALGHDSGAYTEADVAAGAVAFSGWWVDEDGEVLFDEESGPQRSVTLLGRRVRSAAEAIDTICDHPACAPHVAGRVYEGLTGSAPGDEERRRLGDLFRQAGLEIRPLVEAIVTDPSFLDRSQPRPRSPLEWWLALRHLYDIELEPWSLHQLGQVPFEPPNVSGWPSRQRWISAGVTFAKAQTAIDHAWDVPTLDSGDPVGDVLARAGLFEVSAATRSALDHAANTLDGRRDRATTLHALVAMSPEFSLT